ncbi:MAG: putative DNA binding domain-containing protein [Methanoregula sp.]|jgi:predicted HTH transcriptional regulator|uniref:AlbA family DNA-binding domain-containing protein n=1 Tax=Methanoregula sp. TaxID=2052170 RepID=UPI0025F49946|nr:RNA-binding domain-containing protein [Methanoregula sp.]MCK9631130.1 putative DNA binding domain-containing protein [Methanoregula sp.]
MVTIEELNDLIKNGENESVEFKTRLFDPQIIAKILGAFANTKGGTIIIGIDDLAHIVGVEDIPRTIRILKQATTQIDPPLEISIETVQFENKSVVVAKVPKSEKSLHSFKGVFFQRVGHTAIPISSKNIIEGIHKNQLSENELRQELTILANAVERLNSQIIIMGSWKTKIVDYTIGAIIALFITGIAVFVCMKIFGYNPF